LRCRFSQTTFNGNRGTRLLDGSWPFIPTLSSGLFGDLFPLSRRHPRSPRLPAHAPQGNGGGILALRFGTCHVVRSLARRSLGDQDGVAVYVGVALFAFRASWHSATTTYVLGGKHYRLVNLDASSYRRLAVEAMEYIAAMRIVLAIVGELTGLACIYFGYRLFVLTITNPSTGKFKIPGLGEASLNAAPGIFLQFSARASFTRALPEGL
jgi:hypothetical protein